MSNYFQQRYPYMPINQINKVDEPVEVKPDNTVKVAPKKKEVNDVPKKRGRKKKTT